MPSSDTVIVDFESLNSAMQALNQVSGEISNLAGQLQSNASYLQSAMRSNAATTYVEKVQLLKSNFDKAKSRLDEEGVELNRLYQREYEAEQMARQTADGISEFNLG